MTTKRMAFGLLFSLLFLGGIQVSQAGSGYDLRCADEKCGFKATARIGGGFLFEEAPGFCTKCEKWVAVTWKRGKKAPDPLLAFWDPKTGEFREIFKCPKCGQPYVVIKNINDMKFCPKCKKPSLEIKHKMFYD
jgi:hypothetical protein